MTGPQRRLLMATRRLGGEVEQPKIQRNLGWGFTFTRRIAFELAQQGLMCVRMFMCPVGAYCLLSLTAAGANAAKRRGPRR
jgi:hypothetical protein